MADVLHAQTLIVRENGSRGHGLNVRMLLFHSDKELVQVLNLICLAVGLALCGFIIVQFLVQGLACQLPAVERQIHGLRDEWGHFNANCLVHIRVKLSTLVWAM